MLSVLLLAAILFNCQGRVRVKLWLYSHFTGSGTDSGTSFGDRTWCRFRHWFRIALVVSVPVPVPVRKFGSGWVLVYTEANNSDLTQVMGSHNSLIDVSRR